MERHRYRFVVTSSIAAILMIAAPSAPAESAEDAASEQQAPGSRTTSDLDTRRQDSGKLPPDRIVYAVEDELRHDFLVPLDNIDVRNIGGVVTLSGTVTNLLAKERAELIAETVRGVLDVDNEIIVRPRVGMQAYDLEQKITQALLSHPATESFEVTVRADPNGEVRLGGSVNSWAERVLAERVAKGTAGVTAIRNDLEVNYASPRRSSEIATEVQSMLRHDAYVDGDAIQVKVSDGVVTLSGRVGSAAEKRRAAAMAWTAGTKRVDTDALRVDPALSDGASASKPKLSDEQIAQAVRNILRRDPTVSPNKLTADVDGGIVTLRGSVESLKDKRVARDLAQSVDGVVTVRDRLRVRDRENPLSDEEIERRVIAALSASPITEAYEISVKASNGEVDLTGEVDNWFERGTADDLAASIRGVREVDNRLEVQQRSARLTFDPYVDTWSIYNYDWYDPEAPTIWRPDSTIAQEIRHELWWSPFIDESQVTVSVHNGVATLSGTVDNWSEHRAATENAFEGGAAGVVNKLNVEG